MTPGEVTQRAEEAAGKIGRDGRRGKERWVRERKISRGDWDQPLIRSQKERNLTLGRGKGGTLRRQSRGGIWRRGGGEREEGEGRNINLLKGVRVVAKGRKKAQGKRQKKRRTPF